MTPPSPNVRDLVARLSAAMESAIGGDRSQLFDLRDGLRRVSEIPGCSNGSTVRGFVDELQGFVGQLMKGDGLSQEQGLRACSGLVQVLGRMVESGGASLGAGVGNSVLPGMRNLPAAASYLGFGEPQKPVSANADSINETRLGHILVRSGEITFDQLDRALAVQKTTNQRLGEVLIAMEAVGVQSLNEALEVQRRETLRLTPGLAHGLASGPTANLGNTLRVGTPQPPSDGGGLRMLGPKSF